MRRMKKDYLNDVFKTLLWTLLFLVLFSFVPEIKVGSFTSRKVDMLSDIRLVKPQSHAKGPDRPVIADSDTLVVKRDTVVRQKKPVHKPNGVVLFEDYYEDG